MTDEMRGPAKGEPLDIAIVGAGFAGLYMLHQARRLEMRAQILEAGSDVGGTWWWNRYPGARCDVESLQYSYSWDPELQQEWTWSERFATQPEILSYIRKVAERHDMRRDIRFETRIVSAVHDEDANVWTLTDQHGSRTRARKVVLATGCLSTARVPDFPSRDSFAGDAYHTGDWPAAGVDFAGKRVAVIGTGSSGVQVIPLAARQAAHLTVFQRTPAFCLPARNQKLSQDRIGYWKANYAELRQRGRETSSGSLYDAPLGSAMAFSAEEREQEYRWRWEKGGVNFSRAFNDLTLNEESNRTCAEFVRARIRDIVKDPAVAATLTPQGFPIFAKRVCLDSHYYETFNRPNVTLVDLRSTPLVEIAPTGIRTSEKLHEFDIIIYATGFDAITGAIDAIDITGRGGTKLRDKWAEGPLTYLGVATAGFPNLFMITGPGSPSVLSNVVVSIEQHVEFLADLFAAARRDGVASVEARQTAEVEWMAHVEARARKSLLYGAASWYMGANVPGKPRVFMPYVGGVGTFRRECEDIAAAGYPGFAMERSAEQAVA